MRQVLSHLTSSLDRGFITVPDDWQLSVYTKRMAANRGLSVKVEEFANGMRVRLERANLTLGQVARKKRKRS